MYNLLQVFIRNGSILLFLLLQAVCFFLIVQFNRKQGKIAVTTANAAVGTTLDYYDYWAEFFTLQEKVDGLMAENDSLRADLYYWKQIKAQEVDTLQVDTGSIYNQYDLVGAEIINNSVLGTNNMITLNRGREDGIAPHMGVIGQKGLLGVVRSVSENYSSVISLLNRQSRISARIDRSNAFGTLVWEGSDTRFMQLKAVPKHYERISIGDTIRTTGFSTIFPSDIPIGVIEEKELPKGDNHLDIKVRLINDIYTARFAYIVRNLKKEEILSTRE
ncbi:MAG: rod shape-determining protein MreC [Bacteroidota bacterium]